MARSSHPVLRALRRWEGKGLLDSGLAARLREEYEGELQGESQRWSQYLLATTGGAVLVVAASTFLTWVWPEMGYAGQSVTLALIGFLVLGLGLRLTDLGKWIPVAYLLQVAGAVMIFMALLHSENAWSDGTAGGWGVGLIGLILPVALFWRATRAHGVLAALHAALVFLFWFVFLDRAMGLTQESVLWVLDGVILLWLLILVYQLRRPDAPEWALSVFLGLLYSSVVLIAISAEVLWSLEEDTIFTLDAWLVLASALSLWGLSNRAPRHLQRDWYEHQLALCILIGIGFAFITMLETLETGPTAAALVVAGIGVLGLWYSLPRGARTVLIASCLALLISAWYWGAEMSGALGAVLALVVVSVVLFWGATRLARQSNGEDPSPLQGGGADGG
jgi:hypothetical protein